MEHSKASVTITIRARFDSIQEPCHNCDLIKEWEILECSNRARIESNRIAIVTGLSNRIELESSSNRNCDRRFTQLCFSASL